MTTIIHAHPSLTLPHGWTYGARADVPGHTAWHVLHGSGVSALVIERPDYDDGPEDREEFEDALRELEPELDLEAAEPALQAFLHLAD